MKKSVALMIIIAMIIALWSPGTTLAADASYPVVTAVQDDTGTFISMNGELICSLAENRYLRFRATNLDDNWIGSECRGADLCIAYADSGVKGIVVESADFTNNEAEGWFEIAVTGYKDGLDCDVEYSIKGTWLPDVGKFKYTYTTAMDANLEKWYENSTVAQSYYNKNPNSTAPVEVADYHVENISNPDINNSDSYQNMSQRYEWFMSSQDGTNWEKFPKVYVPYPTRSGDYVTIRKVGERCYEGAKFGFTDSTHGGWISTITDTTAGINFELCWYFFDVHMIMYNAVPVRGSAERFEISFGMDFEPISAIEGNELVEGAAERNWRELDEYALPLFSRNNTFDTLISDDVIPSVETANHYIWWASSFDCYRDDTVGYDDNYSVTIKRTGNPAQPAAWNTYTWGRPFEKQSTSNHRYRLSAMVKTENCTGDVRLAYGAQKNHADLFYGVGTHLSDGTPREDIILWQYSDALTGTNDWTPISMEFTVNHYVNSIILEQNGSGQCWFDNVVIEDLGEVTADSYYVYDDFEDGKNDYWTINSSGVGTVADGALVLEQADDATTFAKAERGVKGYGGRWIAEVDAIVNTRLGTVLAAAGVFNIEVSGSTLLVKSGDADYNRVDTKFDTAYEQGTPIKLKVVMDFDTKAFELWYNGTKVDLGEGNYVRTDTTTKLSSFLAKVEHGYSGDITIDRFMLYNDSDTGAVNVSREALYLDETVAYSENIALPLIGINGATISWHSSDTTAVTHEGEIMRGDETKYATLTATITKNDTYLTKNFTVRVAPYAGVTFRADSISTDATSTEVTVAVANDTAEYYTNPMLFMACYSGGKLIAAATKDIELEKDVNEYTLGASHNGLTDRVEIFLWQKNSIMPITQKLKFAFTAQPTIELPEHYTQVGQAVSYNPYQVQSGVSTPLAKGEYTLYCEGMTVDYDAKTICFDAAGLKKIIITTSGGVSTATIAVNDTADTVSVKGSVEFASDFTADNALATYYTASGGAYSITKDDNGNSVLTTAPSNTADTLIFGPSLADYIVEMDFTPTSLSGSGVNTIAVGMRAKSANDRSSYRVAVAERAKFDYANVTYNRLAVGRSKSSNAAEWFYTDYSDQPFASKFALNEKYKLVSSICGNNITAVLYDGNGNVIDAISTTTDKCDFNKDGTAAAALASGKTVIAFHCMVAQISDIKIYGFDGVGEISVVPSAQSANVGDSITLSAFGGEVALDGSMVEYIALSGFDISGSTATATETGTHSIVAKYTDYAGKTKYAVANVTVE